MLRTPWWMRYTVLIINIIQVAVSPADQKTATIKMTACYTPRRGDPYYVTPPLAASALFLLKATREYNLTSTHADSFIHSFIHVLDKRLSGAATRGRYVMGN